MTCLGLVVMIGVSYLLFRGDADAQSVVGQTDETLLKGTINDFFDTIVTTPGSSAAYQKIFSSGLRPSDSVVAEMVQETDKLVKNGRWRAEFLDKKSAGSDFVQFRYLYKGETYPVVWYFTFYRPVSAVNMSGDMNPRAWHCLSISFDTNYQSYFKDSLPK